MEQELAEESNDEGQASEHETHPNTKAFHWPHFELVIERIIWFVFGGSR